MSAEPGSDKLTALRRFLATVPAEARERLGEALSNARENDADFSAETIIASLQAAGTASAPPVDDAPAPLDPEKRYTLKELVCLGIEPFVTEEALPGPVPGRLPRSVVDAWWEAMARMDVEGMAQLEADLAAAYEGPDDLAAFGFAARRKVSLWSDKFVEKLGEGKTLVPELRARFGENLIRGHVTEIARIMHCCEPILVALARIAPGGRIDEFDETAAEQAKPIYLAAAARIGPDTRLLALALLNRLEEPHQIMRLANALGWTHAAGARSRNPEMIVICERLIPTLVEAANAAKTAAVQQSLTSEAADFAELRRLVIHYTTIADALAAEVDFRKDGAWGAQIIKSREAMRSAFDAERLEIIESIILGFMPSVLEAEAPSPEPAIGRAIGAAHLLMAVIHHGQRHGFSNDASTLLGKLDKELERFIAMLLATPHGHREQLDGVVKVLSILFPDLRTQALAKRVDRALGRTPSA